MEVGLVRKEVPRRDAAQRIVAFELFDHQFDAGAVVVQRQRLSGSTAGW